MPTERKNESPRIDQIAIRFFRTSSRSLVAIARTVRQFMPAPPWSAK